VGVVGIAPGSVEPEDLPEGFDVSEPLTPLRRESMARYLSSGMTPKDAFVRAGYKGAEPARQAWKMMKSNPQIRARADYLERLRFDRGMSEATGLDAHGFCLQETMELIESAKKGDLILHAGKVVLDADGVPRRKPDRQAWAKGIQTIAQVEGLLVNRHKFDRDERDISQMGPDGFFAEVKQLVEATGGHLDRAAFDALFDFAGPPIEALASRREASDGEVVDVPPAPEAARTSRQGREVPAAAPDGGQPAREVGVRVGGSRDARDGDLPGVVEGTSLRDVAAHLVRGSDDPDRARRDPGEALRASRLARNGLDSEGHDRKYDPLPGRPGSDRLRDREEDEWDEDEDRFQEL